FSIGKFRLHTRSLSCLASPDGCQQLAGISLAGDRHRLRSVSRAIIVIVKVAGRRGLHDAGEPNGFAQLRPPHLIITRADKAVEIEGSVFGRPSRSPASRVVVPALTATCVVAKAICVPISQPSGFAAISTTDPTASRWVEGPK